MLRKKYGGREVVGVERWFSRGEGHRKLSNGKVDFPVGQILVKSRQGQGRGGASIKSARHLSERWLQGAFWLRPAFLVLWLSLQSPVGRVHGPLCSQQSERVRAVEAQDARRSNGLTTATFLQNKPHLRRLCCF